MSAASVTGDDRVVEVVDRVSYPAQLELGPSLWELVRDTDYQYNDLFDPTDYPDLLPRRAKRRGIGSGSLMIQVELIKLEGDCLDLVSMYEVEDLKRLGLVTADLRTLLCLVCDHNSSSSLNQAAEKVATGYWPVYSHDFVVDLGTIIAPGAHFPRNDFCNGTLITVSRGRIETWCTNTEFPAGNSWFLCVDPKGGGDGNQLYGRYERKRR